MTYKLAMFIVCSFCLQLVAQGALFSNFFQKKSTSSEGCFQSFKEKYRKRYKDNQQQTYRKLLVSQNEKKIEQKNMKGNGKFKMEINNFADLSEDQFRATYANLYVSDPIIEEYAQLEIEEQKIQKQDCFCKTENLDKEIELREKFYQKQKHLFNCTQYQKNKREEAKDIAVKERKYFGERFKESGGKISQSQLITELQRFRNQQKKYFTQNAPNYFKNFMEAFKNKRWLQQQAQNLAQYNIDWTGCSGKVRQQGQCGACYALTAVQNLQSIIAIYAFGWNFQLSVQQIIDCGENNLISGCEGGYLQGPFNYLITNGVTTQFEYPYVSGKNGGVKEECKNPNSFFKIKQYNKIPQGDCNALRTALQSKPISVGIASLELQFYESGTFDDCQSEVDHAVLLVGYDSVKGWKIKNSWGTIWGEEGYAWLADGDTCGICQNAIVPSIFSQTKITEQCVPQK